MRKYVETLETTAVILLGIMLLIVIRPVTTQQLMFAGSLAGLVLLMTGFCLWENWRHRH